MIAERHEADSTHEFRLEGIGLLLALPGGRGTSGWGVGPPDQNSACHPFLAGPGAVTDQEIRRVTKFLRGVAQPTFEKTLLTLRPTGDGPR